MMHWITLLIGMVLLVPVAHAEPSSAVAFDLPTIKMLRSADADNGKALAKKVKCKKCHGDEGVSDDPDDINIAGMSSSYIYKQLKDYKDKKREDKDMYKSVKDLTEQELADLAAWFTSLPPSPGNPNRVVTEQVRKLVYHGDPERLLKACASCHGRDGRGGQFDHPALTGQNRTYLVDSMVAFQDEDRVNDIYGRMRDVSNALTEDEIEALADYYAAYLPDEEEEEEEEE